MDDISAARRWYAEDLRRKTPVLRNLHVIDAFAAVPREPFVGPGPWRIIPQPYQEPFLTPDSDPLWLYHDVLVSIDASRNLNNGMPSFWARNFEQMDIARGTRVLQVGAGTGYYSAVLAEMVGPGGHVTAVEIDPMLAVQAKANLALWPQVEFVSGDGRAIDAGAFNAVIVFAGCTHPAPQWLDGLVEGGRLLMPLTTDSWSGFLLRVIRRGTCFAASSIGGVSIYPCVDGRDQEGAERLKAALAGIGSGKVPIRALHLGDPPPADAERVWYHGPGFWLEREAAVADAACGP
ncbi:protein-L-isoaspartate O-methyltransferase family protein [Bradyrhizobium sp. HKCCYLS1011]|uniref:protein-L-isoaspartate O-methyltransferase family protein n=1 Tax=Bradyrhizobium sp. HKCCYLS1011 TaxID=3420733 RepID=UPI003EC0EEB0